MVLPFLRPVARTPESLKRVKLREEEVGMGIFKLFHKQNTRTVVREDLPL